jgi:hypothetical protein
VTTEYKDYILTLARFFQQRFNLTEYQLKVTFAKEPHDEKTLARVGYNLSYLYINIEVYPPLYEIYEEGNYHDIVTTLAHEFGHHFVEPLSQRLEPFTSPNDEKELEHIVELCTQRITRAIVPFLPESLFTPKSLARAQRPNKTKNR